MDSGPSGSSSLSALTGSTVTSSTGLDDLTTDPTAILTSMGLSHDLAAYMKTYASALDDPSLQMCSFLF